MYHTSCQWIIWLQGTAVWVMSSIGRINLVSTATWSSLLGFVNHAPIPTQNDYPPPPHQCYENMTAFGHGNWGHLVQSIRVLLLWWGREALYHYILARQNFHIWCCVFHLRVRVRLRDVQVHNAYSLGCKHSQLHSFFFSSRGLEPKPFSS